MLEALIEISAPGPGVSSSNSRIAHLPSVSQGDSAGSGVAKVAEERLKREPEVELDQGAESGHGDIEEDEMDEDAVLLKRPNIE